MAQIQYNVGDTDTFDDLAISENHDEHASCTCPYKWEPVETTKPCYNVGDKVRVIGTGHTTQHYLKIGSIATVTLVEEDACTCRGIRNNGESLSQTICFADLKPYNEAEKLESQEKPMAYELTKLQEANLSEDAQALVKVGILDGRLNISDTSKLMRYFIELNMKALAKLANDELAAEAAKKTASEDSDEE